MQRNQPQSVQSQGQTLILQARNLQDAGNKKSKSYLFYLLGIHDLTHLYQGTYLHVSS